MLNEMSPGLLFLAKRHRVVQLEAREVLGYVCDKSEKKKLQDLGIHTFHSRSVRAGILSPVAKNGHEASKLCLKMQIHEERWRLWYQLG